MRKIPKRVGYILVAMVVTGIAGVTWFHYRVQMEPPVADPGFAETISIQNPAPDLYITDKGWLRRGPGELWEMYVEGEPFERGVITGKLSKHLVVRQEEAFIKRIRELIPSDFYLRFLKYFIYWFNRDLDDYIPEEYKKEIYGISLSASPAFAMIGEPYQRMMNYHSAHDIGHALQEMALVGCSSFGVWGHRTTDGNLIIGRNFDFYAGDEFAENKIVSFIKPTTGYACMMITWGGMTGAVSGMNEEGLTVTINAAKSPVTGSARTPVSVLARQILQYAGNIREAEKIASEFETFVSESFLIGSAKDNKAVIIEKSPTLQVTVQPASNYIASTNHFRSPLFDANPQNKKEIAESASYPRYQRLIQLISEAPEFDPATAVTLLRDREGLNGMHTGNGNERALNQLIAHHAVVFKPDTREVWVSEGPWQLGRFICYNLDEIFHTFARQKQHAGISDTSKTIESDPFLNSTGYQKFLEFREMKTAIGQYLETEQQVPDSGFLKRFRETNPDYWEVYAVSADCFLNRKMFRKAAYFYEQALQRVVPRWKEKEVLIKKLAECRAELRKPTRSGISDERN